MLVEGARGDQVELGDERDAVDSIIVSLPWAHLPDIILLVLDLLERLAKGHTSQRESCILGAARRCATFLCCLRNAMPLLFLPRLENSFVPFEFVKQDREIPLLQVARFITGVKNLGLRVEVHSANWEEH